MTKEVCIIYKEEKAVKYQKVIEMLGNIWREQGVNVSYNSINENSSKLFSHNIDDEKEFDFLCCIDFAGGHLTTLLGNCIYNIIPAIQLHLILDSDILKKYKIDEVALNLFLFVPKGSRDRIHGSDDILNLLEYQALDKEQNRIVDSDENEKILKEMVDYVMKEAVQEE